ncbi:MAG: hypothetical protein LBC86_09680 [Oscillospiraceae bacterium]|jgi:hypothetical protein|nr:hypothetical protein [Oscillospiraceae bacterium]
MDKQAITQHIQSTLNLLEDLLQWERSAFVRAMRYGLQGEKRQNRHELICDMGIINYFQCYCMDRIDGMEIHPTKSMAMLEETTSPLDYLQKYRKGLESIQYKLHEAANKFVAPLCMRGLSKPLYERVECLDEAIIEVNRQINEWKMVEQYGTNAHHLLRSNNTQETKHDKFEKKEKYDY